jgi:LuxR family maltose regulon positive regulatory protein
LSELPAKRLAVIKAPAGFGKTSLMAAWAKKLEQSGNNVGWLTVDSDDDEATRFLFYVSHALHNACPDVGAEAIGLILENNLIDPTAILSSLINDLAEIEDDVYLFLEDYHCLSASRIHQAVAYFLTHAPSHCHVVLTTRTEPPLPLATLRARNQLIEIDSVEPCGSICRRRKRLWTARSQEFWNSPTSNSCNARLKGGPPPCE